MIFFVTYHIIIDDFIKYLHIDLTYIHNIYLNMFLLIYYIYYSLLYILVLNDLKIYLINSIVSNISIPID